MAFGITESGFNTKSFSDVQDDLFARARQDFGADVDLSAASPIRQFLDSFAITISDMGLQNEDIDALWPIIADVFWSAYPSTATGGALNFVLGFRNLTRRGEKRSRGVPTFIGEVGQTVPQGEEIEAPNGAQFATTRAATIPQRGEIDVPVEALEPGIAGNVDANVSWTSLSGNFTVRNDNSIQRLHLGSETDQWLLVPNDGTHNHYQAVSVDQIHHVLGLSGIRDLAIRNPDGRDRTVFVHVAILNDQEPVNQFGLTEQAQLDLSANEERELNLTTGKIDVGTIDTVRLAIVVDQDSESGVEVGFHNELTPIGRFYLDAVQQNGSIVAAVESRRDGAFRDGRDRESDRRARRRYFNGLSRGGNARIPALIAPLQDVDSVLSSRIEVNPTNQDRSDQGGLREHAVRVTVHGGLADEIGEALLHAHAAGIFLMGNRMVSVEDEFGQFHPVRFSRPEEVDIRVKVENLQRDAALYPSDGNEQLRNAITEAIGGSDSNGQRHVGFGVGEDAYHLQVVDAAASIPGVQSANILLGTDTADTEGNISIEPTQLAVTRPDLIEIT